MCLLLNLLKVAALLLVNNANKPVCTSAGRNAWCFNPGDGFCYLYDANDLDLVFDNNAVITAITFKYLTVTDGEKRIAHCLISFCLISFSIFFTGLTFSKLSSLSSVDFPELRQVTGASSSFNIVDCSSLVLVEFPKLTTVVQNGIAIDMNGNTQLAVISFPVLSVVTGTSFAFKVTASTPTYCISMPLLTQSGISGKVQIDSTSLIICDPAILTTNSPVISTPISAIGCLTVCCGYINCPFGICSSGLCKVTGSE